MALRIDGVKVGKRKRKRRRMRREFHQRSASLVESCGRLLEVNVGLCVARDGFVSHHKKAMTD